MNVLNSVSYGPIVISKMMRDNFIKVDELSLSQHHLEFNDDPMMMTRPRDLSYLNIDTVRPLNELRKSFEKDGGSSEVIKMFVLQLSNERFEHIRNIRSIADVLVDVGGLSNVIFSCLGLLYTTFGQPFRDIELGVALQKLKEKKKGAIQKGMGSSRYDYHLSMWF